MSIACRGVICPPIFMCMARVSISVARDIVFICKNDSDGWKNLPLELATSYSTAFIANAASGLMSGVRPGFCSGEWWMRASRYFAHATRASCPVPSARILACPRPSSRRAVSNSVSSMMPALEGWTRVSSTCVSGTLSMFVVGDGLQMSCISRKWLVMIATAASCRAALLWLDATPAQVGLAPFSRNISSVSHAELPTSTSTAFIASAAAGHMSGSRSGFCSKVLWMRAWRYRAHADLASSAALVGLSAVGIP
mmetsp:Transcript_13394/g.30437  ORF Transcript_13394/g.30437 Transcript_13394/m.30437 type:complete len:253 (-) Transcript_13394:837-1595(-)